MLLRLLFLTLSVLLIVILASQTALHAVTPHTHSHSHSGEEVSGLWASFHVSLRSEEKQILMAIVGATSLMFFANVVALMYLQSYAFSYVRVTRDRPQRLSTLLRNGRLRYRTFF